VGPVNRITDDQIALLQWYQDPGAAATYPTLATPGGVAFDGTSIWIASGGVAKVSKIDPANGERVDCDIPGNPFQVAFGGTNIWVTNLGSDSVSKIIPS
jgi:hypothetical protein